METLERIKKIIKESCGFQVENINLDARIAEDLHLDSLDLYQMIIEIEDEFAITLPEEQLEECEKVKDIVILVETTVASEEEK